MTHAEPQEPPGAGLADRHGRVATDLRVSLTDRCNLRCTYCMPAEGLDWLPKPTLLTDDEPYPPSVVDPAVVTHRLSGDLECQALRDAALRQHETQVSVYDGHYALSNKIAARLARADHFARLDPRTGELLPRESAQVVEGLPEAGTS